jgi:hypothetical protein
MAATHYYSLLQDKSRVKPRDRLTYNEPGKAPSARGYSECMNLILGTNVRHHPWQI